MFTSVRRIKEYQYMAKQLSSNEWFSDNWRSIFSYRTSFTLLWWKFGLYKVLFYDVPYHAYLLRDNEKVSLLVFNLEEGFVVVIGSFSRLLGYSPCFSVEETSGFFGSWVLPPQPYSNTQYQLFGGWFPCGTCSINEFNILFLHTSVIYYCQVSRHPITLFLQLTT